MSALAWALIAVPVGTGALLSCAGRRGDRAAPVVGMAAGLATLGLAVAAALLRPAASAPLLAGIDAGVRVDGLSAVMVVTVAAVTVAVLLFATGEIDLAGGRSRFFGLMLLFAGAMLLTVTATTLAPLLMAWEVMGATSYALIGFWWWQPHRVRAADTAFLATRAADLGLYLAAAAALAGGIGTLRLDQLPNAATPWLTVLAVGVVLAALGKSAQLPFSFWLSSAMEAPSPVSALLHSAAMVAAGAYLLLRLHPVLAATGWAQPAVAWAGGITALALGLVAVAQSDLKQLLAASTCAHVGFMVLAAGSGGIAGGASLLVAHAATKSLLFLCAGAWLTALGTKHLPALRGAARRYRLVGATFVAGALALAGLAPLSLWATKDEVLAAAFESDPALFAVGLAATAVSAVYSLKAAWWVLRPAPPDDDDAGYDRERRGTRRVPAVAVPSLVLLAAGAVLLGVLAFDGPARALRAALGATGEVPASGWQMAASAVLALGAALLTWRYADTRVRLPRPVPTVLARWLGLERAAYVLVVAPVWSLARALAAIDDRIIDGTVHRVARAGPAAARLAGRLDDAGVDGAVTALAAGARRLGALARRPQTGLVHQYYAQAAVAFVVLALLLLLAW